MDNFYIGQRVVCIYSGDWYCKKVNKIVIGPKKGEILTVLDIFTAEAHEVCNEDFRLQLKFPNHAESYSAYCFKPLKIVETDISVFTEILTKVPSELVHD